MEENLNKAEMNSLNAEKIASDLIEILFSRRSNPPKADCLMEQCESLLEKFQRQIGKWWYNNSNLILKCPYSVWNFQDLSVTKFLREINFGQSRSSKTAIFAILGALNFVN